MLFVSIQLNSTVAVRREHIYLLKSRFAIAAGQARTFRTLASFSLVNARSSPVVSGGCVQETPGIRALSSDRPHNTEYF